MNQALGATLLSFGPKAALRTLSGLTTGRDQELDGLAVSGVHALGSPSWIFLATVLELVVIFDSGSHHFFPARRPQTGHLAFFRPRGILKSTICRWARFRHPISVSCGYFLIAGLGSGTDFGTGFLSSV
jgi:hypothetical protein